MFICLRLVVGVLLIGAFGNGVSAQENVVLDSYTCAEFLNDAKEPADGARLLRSLMMIAWAGGYAAAYQKGPPRADPEAIQLMAATLGDACRKLPTLTAVEAVVGAIVRFSNDDKLRGVAPELATGEGAVPAEGGRRDEEQRKAEEARRVSAAAPIAVKTGMFATYDNFDIPGGDLRRIERVELAKCLIACRSDKACQGVSYDKWNKWCFLKSTIGALSLDPSSVTGVQNNTSEPLTSDSIVRIDRRAGNALIGSPYRTTKKLFLSNCENSCREDERCVGYSFDKVGMICKSFGKIETIAVNKRTISGIKTQAPQ